MSANCRYDEYPVTVRLLLTNIPELFELLPVTVSIISGKTMYETLIDTNVN